VSVNKKDIVQEIGLLKEKHKAIILAHNYQIGAVQEIADFVGDSLELSRKAANIQAEVIVFCGVHFMAETASMLSPDKVVLIPEIKAGCPMADMITADELVRWKADYPLTPVVTYVNTSAEVKAESDVCCTSSNALKVVEAVKGNKILFAPDKNLAAYIARQTDKTIIPWDGYCYVHNNILMKHVKEKKKQLPEAEIWVHPECRPEVIDLADRVLSTGHMVTEARKTKNEDIIVGTEAGMVYRLKKENPGVRFHPVKDNAFCQNMKKITLDKVYASLKEMKYRITVPQDIARRARGAIEKMVNL
jgi:quinolinate synthase